MKKKFLLAIIPALMALSSCAGAGQKVDIKNDNIFVEDTLAHEEIFGDSKIEFQDYKAPLKAPSGPVAPIYGVQYQESSDGEHVHMRFIAATWINSPSNAVKWTRTMYKGHGNGDQNGHVFKEEADKACTKAYTSLANGSEEAITISSINAQYGDGDDYNYFVVYTMLNIPKTTYDDYAIRANITVGGLASGTGIAATVGQTAYATFNMDQDGHFISGRFDGVHGEFEPEYDGEHPKGSDNAVYYDVPLNVGDTFALVYYDKENNVFLLNGTSRFINISGYYFDNSKKTITAKYDGTYTLYLNSADEIHTTASSVSRPLYAKPTNVGGLDSWWGQGGRWTAVYVYNEDVEPKREAWFTLVADGDYLKTTENVDSSLYNKAIFVEMKSGTLTPSWENKNDNNETGNKAISLNNEDCAYLKDNGAGGKYFDWGSR